MSSYDNPLTISYAMGNHDFGAGGDALAIPVPAGKTRCRIEDIVAVVKESFTNDTTAGFIRIGTTGDADKFAELDMQTAADTNGYNVDDAPAADTPLKDNGYGGYGVVDIGQEDIAQLEVAFVAPTGGTPAGIADVTIVISWW